MLYRQPLHIGVIGCSSLALICATWQAGAINIAPQTTAEPLVSAIAGAPGTGLRTSDVATGNIRAAYMDVGTPTVPVWELDDTSAATFTGGTGGPGVAVGVNEGIILTTGKAGPIADLDSSATSVESSYRWNGSPIFDPDLQALVGLNTLLFDSTDVLFRVSLPSAGSLSFNLAFGSNEYPNYFDNEGFDDVFGFLVMNPAGTAVLGSWSIKADSPTYQAWVAENHFNGLTQPMTAVVSGLAPGEYLVRLAIADTEPESPGGDYDSAVFIESGSLRFTAAGVPDSGATLLLLASALGSLALARRRSSVSL